LRLSAKERGQKNILIMNTDSKKNETEQCIIPIVRRSFLFDDGVDVKHKRDGKMVVKCREYVYKYKEYMYLLSNGLWYFESDLNYA